MCTELITKDRQRRYVDNNLHRSSCSSSSDCSLAAAVWTWHVNDSQGRFTSQARPPTFVNESKIKSFPFRRSENNSGRVLNQLLTCMTTHRKLLR